MIFSVHNRHWHSAALLFLVAAILLSMTVKGTGKQSVPKFKSAVSGKASAATQAAAVNPTAKKSEMRAVWVPYYTLDQSGQQDKSEQAFMRRFTDIAANAKAKGMNALVVHVRAFGDALYPSKLYPWSHLTGSTQGVSPGYDPLKDMIAVTHHAGLQFHAWVNPLRIQLNRSPSILAENNPWCLFRKDAKKTNWAVSCASGKYLDPGWEGVRQYVTDGVTEIVKNYAVDGIQFDDYFYPEGDSSIDHASYQAYCAGKTARECLSLTDWRCANVNDLISHCYRAVKQTRPTAVFGVSPQGNLENDRKIGADPAAWCQTRGYVDYICPQVYYNYNNPVLPYDKAVQTWRQLVTVPGIKLYFGLGLYKTDSNADSGSWRGSTNIMAQQIKTARTQQCDGFMFFSYEDFLADNRQKEVQNVAKLFS